MSRIFGFLEDEIFDDKKSGDRKRQQEQVNKLDIPQQNLESLRTEMIVPTTQNMYNNYTTGVANANKDYGDIMSNYKDTYNSINAMSPSNVQADIVNYSRSPELAHALQGYGEFADTGGLNQQAQQDLRARGVSPIRSAYGNALNEVNRRTNLQGGYSPNAGALRAKMARESGEMMSTQMQNINAGIADMVQKGRLAGLSGLSDLSVKDIGFGQQAQLANQSAKLSAASLNQSPYSPTNQKLQALGGMASLYSATPGQASTFGNQVLGSTQNWLGAQGLEQDLEKSKIQGQQTVAALPTGFQSFLKNADTISRIGANVASIPWGGSGTTSLLGDVANPANNKPLGY